MLTVTCIKKFRDKQNQIYGYRLQDNNGQIKDVKSNELKEAIKRNQINVINLKLTTDNRLIDIENEKCLENKQDTLINYSKLCKKIADYMIKEIGAKIKDTDISNDDFSEVQHNTVEKFAMYDDQDLDEEYLKESGYEILNNGMVSYMKEGLNLCIEVDAKSIIVCANGCERYIFNIELNDEENAIIIEEYIDDDEKTVYKRNKNKQESYNKEDIKFLMNYIHTFINKHFKLDSTNEIIYYYRNEKEKEQRRN